MANRKLFVLFITSIFGGVYMHSRKGLFCKDPDTGKLHPINTTWTSSSFCGHYTCKLRRKAGTESINSYTHENTNDKNSQGIPKNKYFSNKGNDKFSLNNTHLKNETEHHGTRKESSSAIDNKTTGKYKVENSNADRYLTDEEISALATLMKSVKKSELEAILEVYRLAQDLYSEIDDPVQDLGPELKNLELHHKTDVNANTNNKIVSYWYDPLSVTNNTVRTEHYVLEKTNGFERKPIVVQEQPVNGPTYTTTGIISMEVKPSKNNVKNTYGQVLTAGDMKNIAYYHPMTSFQRESSFLRNSPQSYSDQIFPQLRRLFERPVIPLSSIPFPSASYHVAPPTIKVGQVHDKTEKVCKTCNPVFMETKLFPWEKNWVIDNFKSVPFYSKHHEYIIPSIAQEQRTFKVPVTYIQPISKIENPVSFLAFSKKRKPIHPYPIDSTYITSVPNPILVNPESKSVYGIKGSNENTEFSRNTRTPFIMSDWPTGPTVHRLSSDVKSPENALKTTNLLPFPFRKNSKIKNLPFIDLKRKKREANKRTEADKEEFEVYLEKSTCETDMRPGFFRMGDASQPFPACCPQRMDSRR